jgi:uncharacterized membrane protein YbjE (DUF340 family)
VFRSYNGLWDDRVTKLTTTCVLRVKQKVLHSNSEIRGPIIIMVLLYAYKVGLINATFVRMQLNDILFMGTFQNIFVILQSAYNCTNEFYWSPDTHAQNSVPNHVNMCKGMIKLYCCHVITFKLFVIWQTHSSQKGQSEPAPNSTPCRMHGWMVCGRGNTFVFCIY